MVYLPRGDNLAGKFGLPGLPTPTSLPPVTPPTQSPTLAPDVLPGQGITPTPTPTPSPKGTQGLFGSTIPSQNLRAPLPGLCEFAGIGCGGPVGFDREASYDNGSDE